ncbi:MAG: alpha/beta fold hydrolase [Bdellovibrionales bacterium]|jgi:pimeloyl-ACP methyl ester carboxylesterase|nr:alpha/beta fold hydrolase [Bdellovibrionales bacterium]
MFLFSRLRLNGLVLVVLILSGLVSGAEALASVAGSCGDLFRTGALNLHPRVHASQVEVEGRHVYFEHFKARTGRPTVVLFSGLFTPLSDLREFQNAFIGNSKGEGLLVFSYSTQAESLRFSSRATLEKENPAKENAKEFTLDDLVKEAEAVLLRARVKGPLIVLGYSYGSAPGSRFAELYRDGNRKLGIGAVSDLVFVAPLVVPGEHAPQFLLGRSVADMLSWMNPFAGPSLVKMARENAAKMVATGLLRDFPDTQLTNGQMGLKYEIVHAALVDQIRAAEAFDLRTENMAAWPRTHFLISAHEVPTRLHLQRETIRLAGEVRQESGLGRIEEIREGEHAILSHHVDEAVRMILSVARDSAPLANQ